MFVNKIRFIYDNKETTIESQPHEEWTESLNDTLTQFAKMFNVSNEEAETLLAQLEMEGKLEDTFYHNGVEVNVF